MTLTTQGLDGLDAYFARYLPQLVLAVAVPVAVLVRVAAADWLSAASFIGLAGSLYATGYDSLAYLMGWTGGYCLVAFLLATYVSKLASSSRVSGSSRRALSVSISASASRAGWPAFSCVRFSAACAP